MIPSFHDRQKKYDTGNKTMLRRKMQDQNVTTTLQKKHGKLDLPKGNDGMENRNEENLSGHWPFTLRKLLSMRVPLIDMVPIPENPATSTPRCSSVDPMTAAPPSGKLMFL